MRHAFPFLVNDLSVLFVIFLVSTLFLVVFISLEQKKCRLETEWFGGGVGCDARPPLFSSSLFLVEKGATGIVHR